MHLCLKANCIDSQVAGVHNNTMMILIQRSAVMKAWWSVSSVNGRRSTRAVGPTRWLSSRRRCTAACRRDAAPVAATAPSAAPSMFYPTSLRPAPAARRASSSYRINIFAKWDRAPSTSPHTSRPATNAYKVVYYARPDLRCRSVCLSRAYRRCYWL